MLMIMTEWLWSMHILEENRTRRRIRLSVQGICISWSFGWEFAALLIKVSPFLPKASTWFLWMSVAPLFEGEGKKKPGSSLDIILSTCISTLKLEHNQCHLAAWAQMESAAIYIAIQHFSFIKMTNCVLYQKF